MLKSCPCCQTAHHINALVCCNCAHKFRTQFPPEPTQIILPEFLPLQGKPKRSLLEVAVISFLATTAAILLLSIFLNIARAS